MKNTRIKDITTVKDNAGTRINRILTALRATLQIVLLGTLFVVSGETSSDQDKIVIVEESHQVFPMQNSSSEEYLGNWYTLGRVSGRRTISNLFTPYFDDDVSLLLDGFHTSFGNERFEHGFTLFAGTISLKSNFYRNKLYIIFAAPEYDLTAAPTPGNRISLELLTPNIGFIGGTEDAALGFEDEFILNSLIRWNFLSRKGNIRVTSDQYELSFHYGPQLNAGQIRISADVMKPLGFLFNYGEPPAQFSSALSIGLYDNVTFSSSFLHKKASQRTYRNYDSTYASGSLEFRTSTLKINAMFGYHVPLKVELTEEEQSVASTINLNTTQHILSSDLTLLLGSRLNSLSEVNGNFDGYFSQQLGERQLLVECTPSVITNPVPFSYIKPAILITDAVRYGITSNLTAGEESSFQMIDDKWRNNLFLTFSGSNIPLRTRGPEQVSKFEYRFGYWPRAGEFRCHGKYRLPVFERPTYFSPFKSIIFNTLEEQLSPLFNIEYSFNRQRNFSTRSGFTSITYPPDLTLSVVVGLTESCILSNYFQWSHDDTYLIDDFYIPDLTRTTPNGATLLGNDFRLILGNPERSLHSIGLTFAWQTIHETPQNDGRLQYDGYQFESFDILLSYTYTAGF